MAAYFAVTNLGSHATGSDNGPLFHHKTSSEKDTEDGSSGAAHYLKAKFGALRNEEAAEKFKKDVTLNAFGENANVTFGSKSGYGIVYATIVFQLALANVKELSADDAHLVYKVSIQAHAYGSYKSVPPWHTRDKVKKFGKKEDLDNWMDSPVPFDQTFLVNFIGNCSNTDSTAGIIPENLECNGNVNVQDIKYRASGMTTEPAEYWKKIIDGVIVRRSRYELSRKLEDFVIRRSSYKEGQMLRSVRFQKP